MTLTEFIILFIVAAIVGALGEALAGYSVGGCAASAIVGFIGAYLGQWIRNLLNMPNWLAINAGDRQISIVWSVIGAAVLVLLVSLVRRRRGVV